MDRDALYHADDDSKQIKPIIFLAITLRMEVAPSLPTNEPFIDLRTISLRTYF